MTSTVWGLVQIRGLGTPYYLGEEGVWIASDHVNEATRLKVWKSSDEAVKVARLFQHHGGVVAWCLDEQGRPRLPDSEQAALSRSRASGR